MEALENQIQDVSIDIMLVADELTKTTDAEKQKFLRDENLLLQKKEERLRQEKLTLLQGWRYAKNRLRALCAI